MKIKSLYITFTILITIFLVVSAYTGRNEIGSKYFVAFKSSGNIDNKGIIKFNHKIHIDNGVQCKDCHNAYESSKSDDNLLPTKKICESCHDVKDEKECSKCHYEGVFKKLVPTKKEIYFSHKLHLKEKTECIGCHKELDKVALSSESKNVFPPMEQCSNCHNSKIAPNNCDACHKNLTNLIPKNHLQSNFLNEHKVKFDYDNSNNNCMMCHSDNFCQVCHTAVKYTGENTPNNFYVPYYTKENATRIDRGNLQKLSTVHTLNYKFTHGLDANQRSFECKTCHNTVDFCSSCHQNNGNSFSGIAPKSHYQVGFVTNGVNSGGGLHASLARKDIENCESCHAVEGADPVCVRCHFDNDGVKNTNPRTHEIGFMRDEKGIWHNTQGAICYVCHTDPNARPNGRPGVGFCGYCHGSKNDDKK